MRRRKDTRNDTLGTSWQAWATIPVLALLCVLSLTAAQTAGTQASDAASKQALDDFSARVNAYAKLRASLEGTLPKLKPTDQ